MAASSRPQQECVRAGAGGADAPIVEHQDVYAGQPREQSCVGAVCTGQGELVEEPRGISLILADERGPYLS